MLEINPSQIICIRGDILSHWQQQREGSFISTMMHKCGNSQEIKSKKQMNKLRKFNYILQQFQMYPQDFFPVLLENIFSLSPFCLSLPIPRHLYFSDVSPIYCLYCMRATVLTLPYRKHIRQRSLSSSKIRIP